MKRIISILTVALITAMMLVATAAPAFAAQPSKLQIFTTACTASNGNAQPFGQECRP